MLFGSFFDEARLLRPGLGRRGAELAAAAYFDRDNCGLHDMVQTAML
jgi:hypothetical protein